MIIGDVIKKVGNYGNVAKNTYYLSIIELVKLLLPFIALPYVINVLGIGNYGVVVFGQTVVSYFQVLINFGLDISVVKDVSVNRNNKVVLSQIVSTVIAIKLLLLVISIVIFLLMIFSIPIFEDNIKLYVFTFTICIADVFFPGWYYQGVERMQFVAIVKTTTVIFYTVLVFMFIKGDDDYILLALIYSLSSILPSIAIFCMLVFIEGIRIYIPTKTMITKYFRESLSFFVSRISIILNGNAVKIVSGIFISMDIVAAFYLAQKMAYAALIPVQMMNQALYPHIACTKDKKFINKMFYFVLLMSGMVALFTLLIAPIAVDIITSKSGLHQTVIILRLLSIYVFLGGLTTFLGAPVLVAFGYSKPFNNSVIISSLINILCLLSCFLIKLINIYMLSFSIIFSEIVIFIYRLSYCMKYRIVLNCREGRVGE